MIDSTTQLAVMIRAQFAAQFRAQQKWANPTRMGGQAATATAAEQRPPRPELEGAAGEAELKNLVALRVRSLSPDDPQRQRKAFRLFLESVLIQAFGRDRLDDRGFDEMIDAVLQRMESDTELHAAVREAGALLLADASPAGEAFDQA